MTFQFPYYVSIKDKCCIGYFGHNKEYVVQLLLLRPTISEFFPEVNIFLSCNDNIFYLLESEKDTIKKSDLNGNKLRNFGFIEEISHTPGKHAIESFLTNINVPIPMICKDFEIKTHSCIICNNCLSEEHKTKIKNQKFNLNENPSISDINSCGWMIGPENEFTYLSAGRGIKTTIVGKVSYLFKTMFPNIEILFG